MIILMSLQQVIIIFLLAAFLIAIILDKKPIALTNSILFLFLGLLMFIAGFTTVLAWEGMGATISGIIYGAAGLVATLIFSIKIYFSSKKYNTRVFHSG